VTSARTGTAIPAKGGVNRSRVIILGGKLRIGISKFQRPEDDTMRRSCGLITSPTPSRHFSRCFQPEAPNADHGALLHYPPPHVSTLSVVHSST
jgi:hypothetical protein